MKKFLAILFCCLSAALFIACGPQEPPKIAVTGIALDRVKVTLTEGETTTLVPTVTPVDATDKSVTWSSSNQAVATVSDGVISALRAGTAVITAKTNDGGITATCTVTVDIAMAAVTGAATHISCRNAEIAGKANLPGTTATDLTFGVLYSTNSGVLLGSATQIQAKSFDSDYNFTVNTEVLEPETTYYYRSYISQNNEITYGDTKSFKTLAVSSMIQTLEATEIDAGVATLNATLDLTDCKYDAIEYGFKLTPKDGTEGSYKANDLSNKAYSYKVETLVRDRQYDVVAYVTLDGRTYTAESKSFTTQLIKANIALNEVSNITEFKATISGKLNVESLGQFSRSAKLYYRDSNGTAEDLKASGTAKVLTLNSDGNFSLTLQDLESGKDYYYAVIATVDGVSIQSEVESFTTADYSVDVRTNNASKITSNVNDAIATLNGTLLVTSIESLSTDVWFLYSEAVSTIDALSLVGITVKSSLSGSSFSANISDLKFETTYYYVACAKVHNRIIYGYVKSFTTTPEPRPTAVDMGLSVKWGSFNIGATKPEEYGDYYAWGEIQTKSEYNWTTYKFCRGSQSKVTKYCTRSDYGVYDNKIVLEKEDDVAAQKLGDNWRMATSAEWKELINTANCTWTWTTVNSIEGYRVKSKKTGKTIFIPTFKEYLKGNYWSSSLYTSEPDQAVCYYTTSSSGPEFNHDYRCLGQFVRPVSD